MENDKSLIDSYLYINYENSYILKKEKKNFLSKLLKKLTKLYSFIEKFSKEKKLLKEEFSSIQEEKKYYDIFLSIEKIIDFVVNENFKMINQLLESIKKLKIAITSSYKKYEDFLLIQKMFNNKLNVVNKSKEIFLESAQKAELITYNFIKKKVNNEPNNINELNEKIKFQKIAKEELDKYKNKISEYNNDLKVFNEKQKELFKLDKELEILYEVTYSDLLEGYYEHQKIINNLISNEINVIKKKICDINTVINNGKLQDYLNNYKQKEEIDFIQYKSQINFDKVKSDIEISINLISYNEMVRILGNYKDVEFDKENDKILKRDEIKKILYLEDKITDKDKEQLIKIIQNDIGQKILINILNQLRANGIFEKSQNFIELVGKSLNIILDNAKKENNYENARNCIILSQTFYYIDLNQQKQYIFIFIKNNKWLKESNFWRGLIELMLKQEFEKVSSFKEQKLNDILLTQLLPNMNNMVQFGIDIRIIIKIIDEFLEKYNYLNEKTYKILFSFLSNDNEKIEKYRKEYKENPNLENELYNNENSKDENNNNENNILEENEI